MSAAELSELLTYLGHANPAVQTEALKILTKQCSAQPSVIDTLTALPALTQSLLPLLSSTNNDTLYQLLSLLVLLTQSDDFAVTLIDRNVIGMVMESLREKSKIKSSKINYDIQSLLVKLLVNLTRTEKGSEKLLLINNNNTEGFYLKILLSLFLLEPNIQYGDVYDHVGHVLLNVSTTVTGRKFLLDPKNSTVKLLVRYVNSQSATRQFAIISMYRNLFLENINHPLLLSHRPLVVELLLLIAGEGEVREEERAAFLPEVLQAMSATHSRHPNPAIRKLVLEIILLCGRHQPSRLYLKSIQIYPILREQHSQHEQNESVGSKELDVLIYDIVPYFILDEEGERKENPNAAKIEEISDHDDSEEKDEKVSKLLDELSLAHSGVAKEIELKRAEQAQLMREKLQREREILNRMEAHDRIDRSVEEADEREERGGDEVLRKPTTTAATGIGHHSRPAPAGSQDDDDLPELIEEPNAADPMNSMD